jgi:hypothetical protein
MILSEKPAITRCTRLQVMPDFVARSVLFYPFDFVANPDGQEDGRADQSSHKAVPDSLGPYPNTKAQR